MKGESYYFYNGSIEMNRNSAGRDFALLLFGMALTIGGIFIFFQNITVSTGGFLAGSRFTMFGMMGTGIPSGLIVVPLIIGVFLMVLYSESIWPKVFTGFSVLLIILAVIDSVRIYYRSTTFFDFVLPLIMMVVGAALCIRLLFGIGGKKDK